VGEGASDRDAVAISDAFYLTEADTRVRKKSARSSLSRRL
jgi:hypothetical protein